MTAVVPPPAAQPFLDARERRWTLAEFRRMVSVGIFAPNEPVELVNGGVYERGLPRLWTRDEYYRLGDAEVFRSDERTELLHGRIIRKVTMNPPHATGVSKTAEALRSAVSPRLLVLSQRPNNVSTYDDPEPDVMVVSGSLDDYSDSHPAPAETFLVVEVSDSTLRADRIYKAKLYAQAGIVEYWIVNINDRTLEVRRRPVNGEYLSTDVYGETEAVAPLAAPISPVRVADLLPLRRPESEPRG